MNEASAAAIADRGRGWMRDGASPAAVTQAGRPVAARVATWPTVR